MTSAHIFTSFDNDQKLTANQSHGHAKQLELTLHSRPILPEREEGEGGDVQLWMVAQQTMHSSNGSKSRQPRKAPRTQWPTSVLLLDDTETGPSGEL